MGSVVPLDGLRVDGGLTRSELLVQSQADLAELVVETGSVDATCLGAAALAAVGAGVLGSVAQIADAVAAQRRYDPRAAGESRATSQARAAWRRFVTQAAAL